MAFDAARTLASTKEEHRDDHNGFATLLNLLENAPRGVLGTPVNKTTGATLTTGQADISGLTITVTTVASRRYRVSSNVSVAAYSGTWPEPALIELFLMEGATQLRKISWHTNHLYTSESNDLYLEWVGVPSAASHTYKIQGRYADGSQAGEILASSTKPATLMVEDIGV